MSGNRLPEHTSLALFGSKRAGYQHDFPSPLDRFVERTEGRMGSAGEIASTRTVLPYYLVHREVALAEEAHQSMAESGPGMLKFRLGLLTSRFRANHPLKACRACAQDDERHHGAPYWHRRHQFPGVWVCAQHGLPLATCLVKSTGVERFSWVLPETRLLRPSALAPTAARNVGALRDFAVLAVAWGETQAASLTAEHLACLYRTQLQKILPNASRQIIAAEYCASVTPLRDVPELAALAGTSEQAIHVINRWIFAPNGATHPLRHLSFIRWLFTDWAAFLAAYEQTDLRTGDAPCNVLDARPKASPSVRQELLLRIRSGESASTVARELGIAVQTAISWATADGLSTPRRPKVLKDDQFLDLVMALEAGQEKESVSRAFGVSVQTVTRVLRSVVGLSSKWHQARRDRAQLEARDRWSAAISQAGALGLKQVRDIAPAAYAWLYRNDRVWLREQDTRIASARSNNSTVQWDRRDTALAAEVQRVATALAAGQPGSRVRLWQLYQAIPELKAKLGALDQLPLTRRAIQVATKAGAATSGPDLL